MFTIYDDVRKKDQGARFSRKIFFLDDAWQQTFLPSCQPFVTLFCQVYHRPHFVQGFFAHYNHLSIQHFKFKFWWLEVKKKEVPSSNFFCRHFCFLNQLFFHAQCEKLRISLPSTIYMKSPTVISECHSL